MRRFLGLAALMLIGSAARAQDTTVVVVRHLPAQQDTSVVVRHLAPAPRLVSPYATPRRPAPANGIIAKDPRFGTFLSFIFPGGGQYYADKPAEGLALTMLGIGAPILGENAAIHDGGDCYATPGFYGGYCRHRDYTSAALGWTVGIASWLYGVATAGTDVQRWNQAHGVRFMYAPGRVGFAVAVP